MEIDNSSKLDIITNSVIGYFESVEDAYFYLHNELKSKKIIQVGVSRGENSVGGPLTYYELQGLISAEIKNFKEYGDIFNISISLSNNKINKIKNDSIQISVLYNEDDSHSTTILSIPTENSKVDLYVYDYSSIFSAMECVKIFKKINDGIINDIFVFGTEKVLGEFGERYSLNYNDVKSEKFCFHL